MNLIRLMHESAMEMSTIADVAKGKGFPMEAYEFYKKAYDMEKKAASLTSAEDEDPVPHFLFLRGAAALAKEAGLLEESMELVEKCRSENPPAWVLDDLMVIEKQAKKEKSALKKTRKSTIKGILNAVNFSENEIILSGLSDEKIIILVPKNAMSEIVKKHWSKKVTVEARKTLHGIMVLEKITAAA